MPYTPRFRRGSRPVPVQITGDTGDRSRPRREERQERGCTGRNLRGACPFHRPPSQTLLSPALPARGTPCLPACERAASLTHAWHHLPTPGIPGANPAASICQRRGSAPGRGHRRRAPQGSSALLPEPGFAMTLLGNTRVRRTALHDTSRCRERVPRLGAAGAEGIPRESLLLYWGKFGPFPSLRTLVLSFRGGLGKPAAAPGQSRARFLALYHSSINQN